MSTLIVTSVSPAYIAECIQFNDQEGKEQLLCILKGDTSSFRISCGSDVDVISRKIRFIDTTFRKSLTEDNLPELCKRLVEEIAEGRVIVETKNRSGAVTAITRANQVQHVKQKANRSVQVAGDKFFKEIAKAFDRNLQVIVAQTLAFNAEQKKPESHTESGKKQLDRKIIVQKDPNWLVNGFFAMVESVCQLFKPTTAKIQEKFLQEAREEARRVKEDQALQRRKARRKKADERLEDDLKFALKQEQIKSN